MPKRHIMPIEKGRIRLRLLEESDLPMTLEWRNQDGIRKCFKHSEAISPEQHRSWFEAYRNRDDDFVFIIEEIQDIKEIVGQLSLYDIDWLEKSAQFGRLLIGDTKATHHGLGLEASGLAVSMAKEVFELKRLYLEVFGSNMAAYRIYRSLGFVETFWQENLVRMERLL